MFSRHKADIECCKFVEHEIELEKSAVPHREGARRFTPHKLDACREEIKKNLARVQLDRTIQVTLGV